MQPINAHRYGNQLGAKTGVAGKAGNSGRKPVRRRRRQQRGGVRLTLSQLAGKAASLYAQR